MNPWLEMREVESVAVVRCDKNGTSTTAQGPPSGTKLHRLDELQNDVVATVAHELRTPLTSLGMALQLCLEQTLGPLTRKQAEVLHAAQDDCERLQTIIDDLLNLTRMEAGCVAMLPQPISIASLVQVAIETHRTLAAERGIRLRTALLLNDGEVCVDVKRVTLVFSNLIANALQHTPSGGQVTICTRPLDGWIRCEVVDTGPGIPKKYRRRVFDKYFRAPGAPPGGVGLGLAIAEKIVQGHGGEIGVESAEGHGSSFWFTLPLVAAVNAKTATP